MGPVTDRYKCNDMGLTQVISHPYKWSYFILLLTGRDWFQECLAKEPSSEDSLGAVS